MTAHSPETESRIMQLRHEAASRELTPAEMREVIGYLRADRLSAHHASDTARKTKAKAAIPPADDLLADL